MSKLTPARSDAYARRFPSGERVGSVLSPEVQVNRMRRRSSDTERRSCDPWKANRMVITAMSTVADTSGHLPRRLRIGIAELFSTSAMNRYPR